MTRILGVRRGGISGGKHGGKGGWTRGGSIDVPHTDSESYAFSCRGRQTSVLRNQDAKYIKGIGNTRVKESVT